MDNRRMSVGRKMSRTQSDAEAPAMQMVSVAVLPPKLPTGMAPTNGVVASLAQGWDESLNYQHNEPAQPEPVSKSRQRMRKIGLTTQREKFNKDIPPFTFKQVPYETWRKHYAKDAEGNYRGTHTPAQDCLLKPDDVRRWRFDEEPVTQADRWTRGSEALPGYAEVQQDGMVPAYQADYTSPPPGEPVLRDGSIPTIEEGLSSREPQRQPGSISTIEEGSSSREPQRQPSTGNAIVDGKTAEEIIAEAEAKHKAKGKPTWKQMLKKGATMALLGGDAH